MIDSGTTGNCSDVKPPQESPPDDLDAPDAEALAFFCDPFVHAERLEMPEPEMPEEVLIVEPGSGLFPRLRLATAIRVLFSQIHAAFAVPMDAIHGAAHDATGEAAEYLEESEFAACRSNHLRVLQDASARAVLHAVAPFLDNIKSVRSDAVYQRNGEDQWVFRWEGRASSLFKFSNFPAIVCTFFYLVLMFAGIGAEFVSATSFVEASGLGIASTPLKLFASVVCFILTPYLSLKYCSATSSPTGKKLYEKRMRWLGLVCSAAGFVIWGWVLGANLGYVVEFDAEGILIPPPWNPGMPALVVGSMVLLAVGSSIAAHFVRESFGSLFERTKTDSPAYLASTARIRECDEAISQIVAMQDQAESVLKANEARDEAHRRRCAAALKSARERLNILRAQVSIFPPSRN